MRLNIDCIRDILIAVSDNLIPDSEGCIEPIVPAELAQTALTQYPQSEVLYWIRHLIDNGLLIVEEETYISESLPFIENLSFTGYQFIDATKQPSVWEKTKSKLLSIAIGSLPILIDKAIEIGTSLMR